MKEFHVKDPVSALTHFIGFLLAITGIPFLLNRASDNGGTASTLVSLAVFMAGLVLLYGASSAYHTFYISEAIDRLLKKLDHMMIFVLIAASYTPVCIIALPWNVGKPLLTAVWAIAVIGIVFNALWIDCPKWISSVIYIAMGWAVIFAFRPVIHALPTGGFIWLLAGGLFYTVGGVIYACKIRSLEKNKFFRTHELFHIFVMAGSFCHFMNALLYLAQM